MDILLISPLALAIAFGLIYGALPLVIHALYHTHTRVVTCPRTGGLAEIRVEGTDRSRDEKPMQRIVNCPVWSEVKGCGGECMRR